MEEQMAQEIEFHVDQRTAELRERGVPAGDAERQARIELGSAEAFKEECREAKGLRLVDELRSDIRYAFRTLRRSSLFTAVAIITLSLGIVVTTSIFSVLDHVLLRPFPFPDAERLVIVWMRDEHTGVKLINSFPNYLQMRAQRDVFEEIGAMRPTVYYVRGTDLPDRYSGRRATLSFFQMLGVQPQIGRLFSSDEERKGRDDVVVISDTCWTRRFGRDPNVIGRVIWLSRNGEPHRAHTIIGVLPREVEAAFPQYSEMWGPIAHNSEEVATHAGTFDVIARLREDVPLSGATARLKEVSSRLADEDPKHYNGKSVLLEDLHRNLTGGDVHQMLPVLMGAVAFVLLLACVNVLNLMLARAAGREREIAARASLGAGPARIFRQLMTEAVVLASSAGLVAAAVAAMTISMLRQWLPEYVLRRDEIAVDMRVLLFTTAITLLASLFAGTLPAWRGSRVSISRFLQSGRSAGARQRSQLHGALVIGEIAVGVVLLAGAGLMINTFVRLLNVDKGFDQRNLLAIETHLDRDVFKDHRLRYATIERLIERVRQIGGVERVGLTDFRPLRNTMNTIVTKASSEGVPMAMNEETVAGEYFEAMGIRHLRGRSFTRHDGYGSPTVALINETAAEKYWPGENPIGQRIVKASPHKRELQIVGVVASVRRSGINREPSPAYYIAQAQASTTFGEIVVRTRDGVQPAEIVNAVRKEMASVHPSMAADSIQVMSEVVATRMARQRFMASFMTVFGCMGLLLTASGIFAVMAYSVRMRSHEMAVRLALGAHASDVFRLVIGRGAAWTAAGLVIGLIGALAGARLLESFLYGISPRDPVTFAAASFLLGCTALIGAWVPSRQASRVDPVKMLRSE
jgi:predicted permease